MMVRSDSYKHVADRTSAHFRVTSRASESRQMDRNRRKKDSFAPAQLVRMSLTRTVAAEYRQVGVTKIVLSLCLQQFFEIGVDCNDHQNSNHIHDGLVQLIKQTVYNASRYFRDVD